MTGDGRYLSAAAGAREPRYHPALMPGDAADRCDVLIVGGGLAGLALARQLLLQADRRVRLVDRQPLPPSRQKVGEATVQLSGYYFARVLEMEEHLLRHHYMKYNLRFHWPAASGAEAAALEGYSQSYIRNLSNIATYQLDRNAFEAELLRVNQADPRFELFAPAADLEVELGEGGATHGYRFRVDGREIAGEARWVVDATGRGRVLTRRLALDRPSPIRHGSTYAWVEGLVDVERLTSRSAREVRLKPERSTLGHLPPFLATNHFCGEGFWFWLIPLHGRTSLGLVYDRERVPYREVCTAEGMIEWVCRQFPLFARDLPQRRIVERGGFASFAHDCAQVISPDRWALVGEAGRFSDPLYSPGGDLIALQNTLVVDAIRGDDGTPLADRLRFHEALARVFYESYLPSYAVSYDTLGDQEAFSLRYTWELAVYFSFYVFPFVNDLFTEPTFAPGYLRRLARLGPVNKALHRLLAGFYRWKRAHGRLGGAAPVHYDFMGSGHLRAAEACFYKVGLDSEAARRVLDEQLVHLDELARFVVSHVAWSVSGDPRARSAAFVRGIDFERLAAEPAELVASLRGFPHDGAPQAWALPVPCLQRFAPALAEAKE
jgi:2-polyprenyl-6-methoxyphenol hydroxylase-like FAD-dependent oxidoreductase